MPAGETTAGAGLIAALVGDGGRPFRYRMAVARLVGLRPPEVQAIARAGRYGAPVPPLPAVRRPRTTIGIAAGAAAPATAPVLRSTAATADAVRDGAASRSSPARGAAAPPATSLSGDRTMAPAAESRADVGSSAAAVLATTTVTRIAPAMPAAPVGSANAPQSIQVPAARVAPGAPPAIAHRASAPIAHRASAPAALERAAAPAVPLSAPSTRSAPTLSRAAAAPTTLEPPVRDPRGTLAPATVPAIEHAAVHRAAAATVPPRATEARGEPVVASPAAITVADLTAIRAMVAGGAPQLPAHTAERAALAHRIDLDALAAGHPLRAAIAPRGPVASQPIAPPRAADAAPTAQLRPPTADARLHNKIAELTREVAALRQSQRDAAAAPRPAAAAPTLPPPVPRTATTPSATTWARRHVSAQRFRVGRG